MSYGYAPPPPPPSASAGQPAYTHQPAPYAPSHGQSRGGGPSGRGRGGHYTNGQRRPEYNPPQPAHPQPAHYEYAGQPYPGHHPAPSYGSHGSYPPAQPQWHPEHGHPPPQAAHLPAPISSTNYHPNYAQPYPPAQYPQQPPSYGPPQPYQAQPPPQHWNGRPAPQPSYGGRPRGGYNDRGGAKSMPGRGGYDHGQPPMSGGYAQPYPQEPPASYPPPQYHYAAPPPAPPPSNYHNSSQGGHGGRGRGGRGGGFRGRGGHNAGGRPQNKHGQHNKHDNNNKHNQPQQQQNETSNVGKKKKRKTNTLGLTPGMESESEDDEGEEQALAKLLGHETYQVDDIAKFLAERRKNFPTKARTEAKKNAELARKGDDEDDALQKMRDKLRKQLAKVESSIKRKRELGDEGDEMRDLSLNDSEDDEKPEVMSSRSPGPQTAPPPTKKADITRHCKYFSTGGTCGKKSKCRFVHDPQVREAAMKEREANNGRLTIQQRLTLNDKEQEDLAILESIQYLREKGVMKKEKEDAAKDQKEGDQKKPSGPATTATKTSLLPAAPASLPNPPPKREVQSRDQPPPSIIPTRDSIDRGGMQHYQGWLREPYGSSSGKAAASDDLP